MGTPYKVVNISYSSPNFVIEMKKESVSGTTLTVTATTESDALTGTDTVTKL